MTSCHQSWGLKSAAPRPSGRPWQWASPWLAHFRRSTATSADSGVLPGANSSAWQTARAFSRPAPEICSTLSLAGGWRYRRQRTLVSMASTYAPFVQLETRETMASGLGAVNVHYLLGTSRSELESSHPHTGSVPAAGPRRTNPSGPEKWLCRSLSSAINATHRGQCWSARHLRQRVSAIRIAWGVIRPPAWEHRTFFAMAVPQHCFGFSLAPLRVISPRCHGGAVPSRDAGG